MLTAAAAAAAVDCGADGDDVARSIITAATAARGHSQTTRGYFDFTAPHSPLSSARILSPA